MSIRSRRFQQISEELIKEELQNGNLPSSAEFISKLNGRLTENNLSLPSLHLRPARPHKKAMAYEYNDMAHQTQADLDILYQEVVGQYNTSLRDFNKFEVEKSKQEYELTKLENELREMILLYNESGLLSSVYDVFDDLSKVDVSQTTASVDIKNHEVAIRNSKTLSKKINPPSRVEFHLSNHVEQMANHVVKTGTPKEALTDYINETWSETVYVNESKANISGIYFIDFQKYTLVNRIEIHVQSGKEMQVNIEFTPDQINWFKLPYYEQGVITQERYSFDFPEIGAYAFRFLVNKKEADLYNPTHGHGYILGFKNIGLYSLGFENRGEFVSQPLQVSVPENQHFTINKVSLMVKEEVPNGTDIKYFIALPPEEGEEIDWKPISHVEDDEPEEDQVIDFKNIQESPGISFHIDPTIAIGEYKMENLEANGIEFYKIGELENKLILTGSERLYAGRNTFGKRYFDFQEENHADYLPSPTAWEAPATAVTTSYHTIEDGKAGVLFNKTRHTRARHYAFSLGVFSMKNDELFSAVPISTDPIAIYLNGQKLFEGIPDSTTKINYLFKTGWNELLVFAYIRETVGATNGTTIDLNLDFRQCGSYTYSKTKPMEKVSLFDLRYNTKSSDQDKYAIMESNGKHYVITNHIVHGLEYELYIDYIEGLVNDEILFKAILTRDGNTTQTTPKLKSYRLRFM